MKLAKLLLHLFTLPLELLLVVLPIRLMLCCMRVSDAYLHSFKAYVLGLLSLGLLRN